MSYFCKPYYKSNHTDDNMNYMKDLESYNNPSNPLPRDRTSGVGGARVVKGRPRIQNLRALACFKETELDRL